MSIFSKSAAEISANDIEALITNNVTEGPNLEYKQQVWGRSDEEVREMLRDISAMANGYGGVVVVGIEEEAATGRATAIHNVPDAESERERIFSSCLANLQPRIIGLQIVHLDCGSSRTVLLIRVPNSFSLHQITHKGLYQFWIRHDRQKSRMSFDEIKDAILTSYISSEKVEQLLSNRRGELSGSGTRLVLMAAPVRGHEEIVDVHDQTTREILRDLPRERRGGMNFNFNSSSVRPTLRGLAITNGTAKTLSLHRNGYFEGSIVGEQLYRMESMTMDGATGEKPIFLNWAIVESVYHFLKKLKAVTEHVGYIGPFSVELHLFHIRGIALRPETSRVAPNSPEFFRDEGIDIGPVVYDEILPERIAKDFCDIVWQAYGFENEPYFINGTFTIPE